MLRCRFGRLGAHWLDTLGWNHFFVAHAARNGALRLDERSKRHERLCLAHGVRSAREYDEDIEHLHAAYQNIGQRFVDIFIVKEENKHMIQYKIRRMCMRV